MLKTIWLLASILVSFLILIRVPNNTGLESITSKTNLLGSTSSAEKILNRTTWVLICTYLLLASKFNLSD